MSYSITLVRHARSEANAAGIWQGQGDAVLDEDGRSQAMQLGDRLTERRFDVVASSDLSRTQETARIAGLVPDRVEKRWREIDLGDWEGRTFGDVAARHRDLLEAIRRGDAISFGGHGESIGELEERSWAAFDDLVDELGGEGHALVFTHGAVIDSIVGRFFGRVPGSRTFPITTNTAMTGFSGDLTRSGGKPRLAVFNDATHLGPDVGAARHFRAQGVPIVGFARHGVTEANLSGRIQGQQCWGLHADGFDQADRLAAWYGPVDRVVSSPLQRARETAEALDSDRAITFDDTLMEQSFGRWEGLLHSELGIDDQELLGRIYGDGEDLPRGHTGETFSALITRLGEFLSKLDLEPTDRTLVVSHGAAIKALVAEILGATVDIQSNLAVSANTGVTHVAFRPEAPMLLDYAVAPHLEES